VTAARRVNFPYCVSVVPEPPAFIEYKNENEARLFTSLHSPRVQPIRQTVRWVAAWLRNPHYTGRKTGRRYQTVNVSRRGKLYIFALTYGSQVQWVQNVRAAGECEIRTRGHDIRLVRPEVFTDPTQHLVPRIVRAILRFNRVSEFLRMRSA